MGISLFTKLFTGIALFLFGMALMGDGLKKVAGNKLEMILYRLTGSPLKGGLFGAAITAVIQSSSATSVMVVGFVNSGIMTLYQAIPVVLGAIFGTSITGWVICLSQLEGTGWLSLFSTNTLTCISALVGIVFRMFSKSKSKKDLSEVLMGFAVLMVGMSQMSGAVSPLKDSPEFISLLTSFSNPFLGIIVGVAFTSILQSASAAIGILQALALTGAITLENCIPLTMGIAVGAAVPVLLTAIGATEAGKRTAFAYLISNALGAVASAIVFYGLNAVMHFTFLGTVLDMVTVSWVNTIYRFIIVFAQIPLTGLLVKITGMIVKPDKKPAVEPGVKDLEEIFLDNPTIAIEHSRIAITDMAKKVKENMDVAVALLHEFSEEKYGEVEKLEDIVDQYEDKLGTYLLKITEHDLSPEQSGFVSKYLRMITDFERMSDHAMNLADAGKELFEKKKQFSELAQNELLVLERAANEIVELAMKVFASGDKESAQKVEPLEEIIDNLVEEMKFRHVERLQHGQCTIGAGFIFNDILTNYERIADHCSNIAISMVALDSESFDMHEYVNSIKLMKDEAFSIYFTEYTQKYALNKEYLKSEPEKKEVLA